MFFTFELDNITEETVHKRIDTIISYDRTEKGFFGLPIYSAGLHFERNDRVVSGIFTEEDELEGTRRRGAAPKTRFKGKFKENNGKVIFDGFIFPDLITIMFLVFLLYESLIVSEWYRWTFVVILIIVGIFTFKQMNNNLKQLKELFKQKEENEK